MLNIEGGAQNATDQNRVITAKNTVFHRQDTAFIFDVDECLVEVNKHQLTREQHDLLSRLYHATNGAVIFLTNNTGKTVSAMHDGIPCISEFGMVSREVGKDPVIKLPKGTPRLDMEAIIQYVGRRAKETRFMPKEASLCFNFYSDPERIIAQEMAQSIMNQFNLHNQNYEVSTLVDSVEVMPKNVRKANRIHDLMKKPEFEKRRIVVLGDSGTDREGMEITGHGVAVGSTIPDADYVLARAEDHKHMWTFIDNIVYRFEKNKSILASRALIAPI